MSQYNAFLDVYRKAHPEKEIKYQYIDGQKEWNGIKKDPDKIKEKIAEYKLKASKIETKQRERWWSQYTKKIPSKSQDKAVELTTQTTKPSEAFPSDNLTTTPVLLIKYLLLPLSKNLFL